VRDPSSVQQRMFIDRRGRSSAKTPLPAVLDPTHRYGHIARRACRSRSARRGGLALS
jgi:hypothetical protein